MLFRIKVDLGRCKRQTDSGASWIREGYDSAWWDRGSNMNENCVKDPKRIKVVDAMLTHAARAGEQGYFIEAGKLVKKAPKTGWYIADRVWIISDPSGIRFERPKTAAPRR